MIMSKTYGAKDKSGKAFYDSYPLENLTKMLCYEDIEEAGAACQHYGLTVEGDQVLWRHSRFGEPKDPEKGHIIPLRPRKMMRTIESKLNGATRLSVCRGGVSGEGATLATGSEAAAVEEARKNAQEAAEKARKEETQRHLEAEAKARAQAEKLEKERLKQEKLAAEKRARAEAVKQAEMERVEKERLKRERIDAEQRHREEEARRIAEANAAAERAERKRLELEAREREEARKRAEEEVREQERQQVLAKQREEEARRQAEIKAAKEREEKKRREEEERHRIAELKRKAEEDRIRKVREEEARRIEMMWREKIEKARKVLAWRLWRKQMQKQETLKKSRRSLDRLDPTSTNYPEPLQLAAFGTNQSLQGDSMVTRHTTAQDELENNMYRLATAPKEPIDIAKLTADCFMNSPTHGMAYPPCVSSNKNVMLFKLAVLLPERTPGMESMYDTLRMWVNSHIKLNEMSSQISKGRIEVRTVAVIGNEDPSKCKDCNAAVLIFPSAGSSSHVEFPEGEVQELLDSNVPRMVLVLGDESSSGEDQRSSTILDHFVGNMGSSNASGKNRPGVATPKICHFDSSIQKCFEVVVSSYFESVLDTSVISSHTHQAMGRVTLSNLGFLCLQRLIQHMDAGGFFQTSGSENSFFTLCKGSLGLMITELSHSNYEMYQTLLNWPPQEFVVQETESIPNYFDGNESLPSEWCVPSRDFSEHVSALFKGLLDRESFPMFVETYCQNLPQSTMQNLLTMLDNGDIFSCFANVVSLFVDGELSLEANEEAVLYYPIEIMSQIIERSSSYEVPLTPEPVVVDIPSYLYQSTAIEEKENTQQDNISTTPEMTKTITKRKPPELIEPETPADERVNKRVRSNAPAEAEETEEQKKSKQFTSFLEALLG